MKDIYSKYCGCGYRVTTDSRAIKGGEMFFALRGENFDGNDYAMKALDSGAAWAVVNSDAALPDDPRLVRVGDPLVTLRELAVHHRNNVGGGRRLPVIGLTGTNGKTTTKELVKAALSAKYNVTATEGNLNNDIGVPLSLLRITPDTDIAVIEMGANHPDDIAKLVKVSQPDYGLITNVGMAHLLGFGSLEGVMAAKGELYRYLSSREGSVVFINNDDERLLDMASRMVTSHIWSYGLRYQGAEILETTPDNPYLGIRLSDGTVVRTALVGSYNAANVLAALAVAEYFGVDRAAAVVAIGAYVPKNNRSQMLKTAHNTVIVDAYNANPSSMKAAIENFSAMKAGSRLALLGDMRELGDDSVKEHCRILRLLEAEHIDAALVGDEFGKALKETGFKAVAWFPDSASLKLWLESNPVEDRVILVKGSRGIMMEKVLESI